MVGVFKGEIEEKLKRLLIVQKLVDKKLELYDADIQAGITEADPNCNWDTDWEEFMTILGEIE
ncbi:MAG: hypothetical protein FWG41_03550 [Methanomassiliicoccaceae archaeon]|nr:hypothetical protein [Methanomassiliicoccaceae archaeon]